MRQISTRISGIFGICKHQTSHKNGYFGGTLRTKKTGHRTLEKTQGILQKIQAIYFKIQGTYFKISALYFSRKIASDFQQLTNGVFQAFKSRRNRVKNRRVPHPPAPIMPV